MACLKNLNLRMYIKPMPVQCVQNEDMGFKAQNMKGKLIFSVMLATGCVLGASAKSSPDSVTVRLENAGRSIGYKTALLVDGKTVTLKDETLSASDANTLAVLVINGGKLVLDHCTITKQGDGVSSGGRRPGGPGQDGGMGLPDGFMAPPSGDRPPMPPAGEGKRPERPESMGPGMGPGNMPMGGPGGGMGGPGGGDDGFNFYGTNSAVVALGKGSAIEMIGCKVMTEAEYANAVFAADDARITIIEGIDITTTKNSSRGLFATTNGVIEALGVVNIDTKGAHCAALATDRGGGTVTVGYEGTADVSQLNTAGDGSPCIYSTGNITAYNAKGTAQTSQTMVIEGKNTITIDHCTFDGKSPEHGGIMLYQSMSGDAEEGTSVLNMSYSTIRDNTGTAMILVTNTHTVVNMDDCTFLDVHGNALTSDSPLVTARNCNTGGRSWGREGSNGGQIELNIKHQRLAGTLLANETESVITLTADSNSDTKQVKSGNGKGTVHL